MLRAELRAAAEIDDAAAAALRHVRVDEDA